MIRKLLPLLLLLPLTAQGAITFVDDDINDDLLDDTSCVVNKPTGTQEDDVLIFFAAGGDENKTITLPSGATSIHQDTEASGPGRVAAVGYKVAGGSEPSTYTFTWSSSDANNCWVGAYRGVDTSTPLDVTWSTGSHYSASDNDMTPNQPDITTTTDGAWVIALHGGTHFYDGGAFVCIAPSGMTVRSCSNDGDFQAAVAVADAEDATAGSFTVGDWTHTGGGSANDNQLFTIALKPAASAPAVTADDSTPGPGDTITITANPVFDSAMTEVTCNGETKAVNGGATTSSAGWTAWALSDFVPGGDAEAVAPDNALTCTVTDGSDTADLTLTFDFEGNESSTGHLIVEIAGTIDYDPGIACSAAVAGDDVRADRVSGTLDQLATNSILTGVTSSYSVNAYCWDVTADAWIANSGNPMEFGLSDTTAPTFVSSSINATGDEWSIVFDEAVEFGGANTGFSGSCTTAGAITLTYSSGTTTTTLVYTGDVDVFTGDSCTLSYSPGTVEDVSGNALASFSAESVTNGSTETPPSGDSTAPTCSQVPAVHDKADVWAALYATCSDETETGVVHYFGILANDEVDPTAEELKDDHGGFIDRAAKAASNGAEAQAVLGGLTASTDYDAFHTVCDASGNCSTVVQIDVRTVVPANEPGAEGDETTRFLRDCGDGTYRTICP